MAHCPFFLAATVKNEGRIKTAGGRAGEKFRRQTTAEDSSPEPERRTPEPAKHTCNAG